MQALQHHILELEALSNRRKRALKMCLCICSQNKNKVECAYLTFQRLARSGREYEFRIDSSLLCFRRGGLQVLS